MHLYHGLCCKPKMWYLKLKVSTEGILEVMRALVEYLKLEGVLGERLSFGCFGGSLFFGVQTFKQLD